MRNIAREKEEEHTKSLEQGPEGSKLTARKTPRLTTDSRASDSHKSGQIPW